MLIIQDCGIDMIARETYAVVPDETESTWLVIRKTANERTGYSPLVCTGDTLPEALSALAEVIEG